MVVLQELVLQRPVIQEYPALQGDQDPDHCGNRLLSIDGAQAEAEAGAGAAGALVLAAVPGLDPDLGAILGPDLGVTAAEAGADARGPGQGAGGPGAGAAADAAAGVVNVARGVALVAVGAEARAAVVPEPVVAVGAGARRRAALNPSPSAVRNPNPNTAPSLVPRVVPAAENDLGTRKEEARVEREVRARAKMVATASKQ
mmetsp:Transcript_24480/g.31805  ORF Transcript_24480/g.31805 Transcript_24480/m.31805 type:complete len:201 (-) Transcript_24480:501-1103(-)